MATLPSSASAAGGLWLWRWRRRRDGPTDRHALQRRLHLRLLGTALPNDLVGQWKTTLGYIPAYYTGLVPLSTTDFIGSIAITVYFQSDGAYRFDLSTASRYFGGNCFRTTQWSETGGASVAEANLTFTSTHASNIITDSCGKFQYIDPAPTGTATYAMTHAQDQTGWPILRLRIAGGDDLVLEKCRDCR